MVNSDSTRLTPKFQTPADGAGGRTSPRYIEICELCARLRPGLVMTPDGPVKLCRRCAYKLGYTAGGKNDKQQ